MQLVGIRGIEVGAYYDVLAVKEPGGLCPVLEAVGALQDCDWGLHLEVTQTLYDVLPQHGPDAHAWKALRGEIREYVFGYGPPDPAFRIVWFQGETERRIICSSGHLKTHGSGRTPPGAIPLAEKHRERYFWDLARGRRPRLDWIGVL